MTKNQCQHLKVTQRNELLELLYKYEYFFDGTLGARETDPLESELKEGVEPIFLWPHPVLKVHEEMIKYEVERLVLLGFLEVANDS